MVVIKTLTINIALVIYLLLVSPFSYAQISLPADIVNLAFHIDAHSVNGVAAQPVDGASVTEWQDLSGNVYHLNSPAASAPFFQATGFDGVRPALRFQSGDSLSGPDILPTVAGNMTILFVSSHVTHVRNFMINLNGNNSSNSATTGRYSFHTPWTDGNVYFDSGGCCGSARVRGPFPNPVTETSIFSAVNDLAGARQILRVDGSLIASDATGHAADSTGGIVIGSTSGRNFNGRIGEIIVYNRALNAAEIEEVEEYLFCKWKPALSTETCADVSANKTVAIIDSPVNDYSLPGSIARYAIAAENAGPFQADDGTVVIIDTIPDNTALIVSDIAASGSGPVLFTDGTPSSGLTYSFISLASIVDDVDFSNDGGASFTYVPAPGGVGQDENVTHIRIRPQNDFTAGTTASPTNFSVSFDVVVE